MASGQKINFAVVGGSLLLASVVMVSLSVSGSELHDLAVELDEAGGRAEATVTESDCDVTRSVTQERGLTSSRSCIAHVTFQTTEGQTIESTLPIGLSRGTTFTVLYDPASPARFTREIHLQDGSSPALMAAGVLLGLVALGLVGLEIRGRGRSAS